MSSDADEGEDKITKSTLGTAWNRWKLASLYMDFQRNLKDF
jgi:hypothetical protein